jgi:hypothetical protein
MPVGRVVGNPGAARYFAQGKGGRTEFGNDADRPVQESFTQMAVMVGLSGHGEKDCTPPC